MRPVFAPPTSVRFTIDEAELLERLQEDLGLFRRADVLRVALRELAKARGLLVDGGRAYEQ